MVRRIADSTFLLVANGSVDSPPAAGFRDVLIRRGATVLTHHHPLGPEEGGRHVYTRYADGRARRRVATLPSRPPLTFPLDLALPPRLPRADIVLAFNCLHAARAIAESRGREVVYYAVDYVPDRFGVGTALTRAYDAIDAWVCRRAAARWEVSGRAAQARAERHGLGPDAAPASVVPIGAWAGKALQVPVDACQSRRVVFIGHLVERMGGDTVVEAMRVLAARGIEVVCDIAGHGPKFDDLQHRVEKHGLEDRVTLHGFVGDPDALEALLAGSAIALAPYRTSEDNFTQYADPSKLKSYVAAGLPVLVTDVPPNAGELQRIGGGEVLADSPGAFADAIERLLGDPQEWERRRAAALEYARSFDWDVLVDRSLAPLGFA